MKKAEELGEVMLMKRLRAWSGVCLDTFPRSPASSDARTHLVG